MFTGIIRDIAIISQITKQPEGALRYRITSTLDIWQQAELGASIACSGICLTVIDKGFVDEAQNKGSWFDVDLSQETLSCTIAKEWREGQKINLEPAMRAGDEFGGHIVSGHVDGVGQIMDIHPIGDNAVYRFGFPEAMQPFIAAKGSVTINGISLTVNKVTDLEFEINLIPHTLAHTNLGSAQKGDKVNLEIDLLARYAVNALQVLQAKS